MAVFRENLFLLQPYRVNGVASMSTETRNDVISLMQEIWALNETLNHLVLHPAPSPPASAFVPDLTRVAATPSVSTFPMPMGWREAQPFSSDHSPVSSSSSSFTCSVPGTLSIPPKIDVKTSESSAAPGSVLVTAGVLSTQALTQVRAYTSHCVPPPRLFLSQGPPIGAQSWKVTIEEPHAEAHNVPGPASSPGGPATAGGTSRPDSPPLLWPTPPGTASPGGSGRRQPSLSAPSRHRSHCTLFHSG